MRRLTEREKGILAWLGWGINRKTIAMEMGLSLKTMDAIVIRIMSKTGIRNFVRLIHLAIVRGLCPTYAN